MQEKTEVPGAFAGESEPTGQENLYPGWKNAEEKVLQLLKSKGYGTMIPNEQLMEWFYIEPLVGQHSYSEYRSLESRFYHFIVHLKKSLIVNHRVCISNETGVGYEILHPNDQVKREALKHKNRAFNDLGRQLSTLINLRHEELDPETQRVLQRELAFNNFMSRGLPRKTYREIDEQVLLMVDGQKKIESTDQAGD